VAIKINEELLHKLGVPPMDRASQGRLLKLIYDALETKVGTVLADRMTDPQLDEFEGYFDRNDDAGAFAWLETTFPDYRQIVNDCMAEELAWLEIATAAVGDALGKASSK